MTFADRFQTPLRETQAVKDSRTPLQRLLRAIPVAAWRIVGEKRRRYSITCEKESMVLDGSS
jgi:hypothetical protein